MQIENVHFRDIPARPAAVGAVLDGLGSDDDRLWPSRRWPTLRFELRGPLAVGTPARHGPIRYAVEAYEPGRRLVFRFAPGVGLVGTHGFEIQPLGERRTRLTHVLRARVEPKRLPLWPVVRGYHDAVIEDLLAQADRAASGRPVADDGWPLWLRLANGAESWLADLRGLSSHPRSMGA